MAGALSGQDQVKVVAMDSEVVGRGEQSREANLPFWLSHATCSFGSALHVANIQN